MVVRVRFPLRVHDFIILMKGDIIYNLIKLLQIKKLVRHLGILTYKVQELRQHIYIGYAVFFVEQGI